MQQDLYKNFKNWWRNAWDNWMQSWQLTKFNQQKLSQFWPPLKLDLFLGWDFSTFFFNSMPQEYQNEKSPILKGQKKCKTLGKVKKMPEKFTRFLQRPCTAQLVSYPMKFMAILEEDWFNFLLRDSKWI